MTTNESRMDDELARRGESDAAMERWLEDPYNAMLAQGIADAWLELKHSYERAFNDAYLPDEFGLGEVLERFKVKGRA